MQNICLLPSVPLQHLTACDRLMSDGHRQITPESGRKLTERLGWSTRLCFTVSSLEERLKRHFICVFWFSQWKSTSVPARSAVLISFIWPVKVKLQVNMGKTCRCSLEVAGKVRWLNHAAALTPLKRLSQKNVVYLRSHRPCAACTHTKNTPDWNKPTFSLIRP